MVCEVNKLIFNTLISEGAVYLPDVGVIYLHRIAAAEVARDRVAAPRISVQFSSQMKATSLIDVISNVANVDSSQADDIYTRWLDKVRTANGVDIEGIGRVVNKSFVADEELLKSLNPYSVNEIKITRRSSNRGFVAAIITLIVLALAGYILYTNLDFTAPKTKVAEVVEQQGSEPKIEVIEIIDEPTEEVVVEEVNDWREAADIRHWVIIGSYSTTENAERAIAALSEKYSELMFDYIKLGSMYAVSPFGSSDIAECEVFKSEYKHEFTQMWIHTPKRFKE
ncbi:MAG: hypothetical protein IKU96_00375 [Alistipes sp.]|nr:hypothetical protein [Alistipes sp.]